MRTMHILTTDRPTDNLGFWKISNGHISATGHPIHVMFGCSVGFSGTADRMDLLPVGPNPGWRLAAILKNFESLEWVIRSTFMNYSYRAALEEYRGK